MSELINLNTLFASELGDTQQSLLNKGIAMSDVPLGRMADVLAPKQASSLRKAAGGLFGVDTSTSKERLKQALSSLDLSNEQDQAKAVELVRMQNPAAALTLQQQFKVSREASATSAAQTANAASNTSNAATNVGNMGLRQRELNAAAAPSTDRDIVQMVNNGGELTTIMEDGRGNFFDIDNNPMQIPQGFKVLESATLSGAREDLGLGASAKESLEGSEIAVRQFLATGEDALEMLKDSPDVNTFVAKAAGIAIGLEQEAKALGRSLGLESEQVTELTSSDQYDATFRELGINENRTKGLITSLAFQAAAASGQTGRDISNRDIERFIVEIGGNASNPEAFRASLVDVMERSVRNFKTKYSVLTREEYQGTLDFNRTLINDDGSSGSARVTLPPSSGAVDTGDLSDMTTAELLESLR